MSENDLDYFVLVSRANDRFNRPYVGYDFTSYSDDPTDSGVMRFATAQMALVYAFNDRNGRFRGSPPEIANVVRTAGSPERRERVPVAQADKYALACLVARSKYERFIAQDVTQQPILLQRSLDDAHLYDSYPAVMEAIMRGGAWRLSRENRMPLRQLSMAYFVGVKILPAVESSMDVRIITRLALVD